MSEKLLVPEDGFSVVLQKSKNITHLKYEDEFRNNWSRTVCGLGFYDDDPFVNVDTSVREVKCEECRKKALGNPEAIFVNKTDFDYGTENGKKRRKIIEKKLEDKYKEIKDSGGSVSETVEFLNGSSISINAYDPSMGDCGDSYVYLTFIDTSYGETTEVIVDLPSYSFNKVADALIYLLSKAKVVDKGLFGEKDFYDLDETVHPIIGEVSSKKYKMHVVRELPAECRKYE